MPVLTKLEKKKLQEQKKLEQQIKKHEEEMKKQQEAMPKAVVRRDIKANRTCQQKDIFIEKVTLTVGSRILLEGADIDWPWARRFGLIGKNGIGKTQLLGALARGEYGGFEDLQVLLVAQEVVESESSPVEYLLESDVERAELIAEEKKLERMIMADSKAEDEDQQELSRQIVDVQNKLMYIDAHKQEPRAAKILSGLGFSSEMMNRSIKSLSGGWRMRCNIARALFVEPDVLFLDEPTNHLDLDSVMWLEHYLQECDITVVVVSHDREFLNHVVQETILFKDQKLTYYKGNYDTYEQTLADNTANHNKEAIKVQKERQETKAFIDKFRANKILASMVQCRIKMLDRMDDKEVIKEDNGRPFFFPNPEQLPPPCMTISDGYFNYENCEPLLEKINFGVDMDHRIALVGPNGCGKSTMIKLLTGQEDLSEGYYQKHPKLRISVFTQHHMDQLQLKLSPLEQLQAEFPGENVEKYRGHLARFGIFGDIQLRPMYKCSGGQKSRVAFSMFVWNQPHIMVLDEPTNHLDIEGVNALIDALNQYEGGVLIVSHDQHLIQSVCNDIYLIDNKKCAKFEGDFQDYRDMLKNKYGY